MSLLMQIDSIEIKFGYDGIQEHPFVEIWARTPTGSTRASTRVGSMPKNPQELSAALIWGTHVPRISVKTPASQGETAQDANLTANPFELAGSLLDKLKRLYPPAD